MEIDGYAEDMPEMKKTEGREINTMSEGKE